MLVVWHSIFPGKYFNPTWENPDGFFSRRCQDFKCKPTNIANFELWSHFNKNGLMELLSTGKIPISSRRMCFILLSDRRWRDGVNMTARPCQMVSAYLEICRVEVQIGPSDFKSWREASGISERALLPLSYAIHTDRSMPIGCWLLLCTHKLRQPRGLRMLSKLSYLRKLRRYTR